MMPVRSMGIPRLSELLVGFAHVSSDLDIEVPGLAIDSRQVRPGDLFLACEGGQVHGMRFAQQAIDLGAKAIITETEDDSSLAGYLEVPVLKVPNLSQHIGEIAARFYGNPSRELSVVGITGTNGKTSCSHFLAQALNNDKPCGIIGTLGIGIFGQLQTGAHTTPDAVSVQKSLDEMRLLGVRYIVMEASSHGLEQGRVGGVAFDVAVYTNLSRDHLDYHGDMEMYGDAKQLLFRLPSVKYAVINIDDEFGLKLLNDLPGNVQVITYGFNKPQGAEVNHLRASKLVQDPAGIKFGIETQWGRRTIRSTLLGQFNASNMLACLGALLALGVPMNEAISRLEKTYGVAGRMERVDDGSQGRPLVIVDYAHTADALEKVLTALWEHIGNDGGQPGRLWCVFGCGGDRDRGKRPLMGRVAERLASHIILTDDNPRNENPQRIIEEVLNGIKRPGTVSIMHDRPNAICTALRQANSGDVVLVAGKGHESYQIIGSRRHHYDGDKAVVQAILAEPDIEVRQ